MARVVGLQNVQHKLHAIGNEGDVLKRTAAYTRGLMVTNMRAVGARKTGLTAASLQPRQVSPTKAAIWGSPVAVWIDTGTGLYGPEHHVITPKAKRALAFYMGNRSSLRLSGRPRSGAAGLGASRVVVRSVKGMKPRPYINRSVQEASQKVGMEIGAEIVRKWDSAH